MFADQQRRTRKKMNRVLLYRSTQWFSTLERKFQSLHWNFTSEQ